MKKIKLSAMMFLQYMMLAVWFVPMLPYVQGMKGGTDWAVWCGLIMGFGTFTSPLFGMFADRFFNAEKVLAACNLVGTALLVGAFFVTSPAVLFVLMLIAMCFYMPTWSLTASIAMANTSTDEYSRIRVLGTIGWVASGVFSVIGAKCFGITDFDSTRWIFAAGTVVSLVGGLLAFFLPPTAPAQKGQPMSVVDALGLRALVLLKNREFRDFVIVLLLAMIPFQWYNVYCAAYLKESGFRYLTVTMNLGQAGEIGFMLLVPLIIRRVGYLNGLGIALAVLAFRNACFSLSVVFGIPAFDFGGILVHGLIFGLFIVGAQMFVNDHAPRELRNQAQGMINLVTAGVGVFASNMIFDAIIVRSHASGDGFGWAFLSAFHLSVAVMVLALLLGLGRTGQRRT